MPTSVNDMLPEMAPDLADRFVEYTKSIEGIVLDYSIESLQQVDEIIEGMRRDGLTVNDVRLNLLIIGCYVGEVFVRNHHLKWVRIEDSDYADSPTDTPFVIEYADSEYTSPIDKVIKRLESGEENYLPFYYQVILKLMEGPPGQ